MAQKPSLDECYILCHELYICDCAATRVSEGVFTAQCIVIRLRLDEPSLCVPAAG